MKTAEELAREAGGTPYTNRYVAGSAFAFTADKLERLIALARVEGMEEAALYLDAEHQSSRERHNYAAFYARGVRALKESL